MMIIDSHAHYSHLKFDNRYKYLSCETGELVLCEGEREDIFAKMKACGICAFIEPGITLSSNYDLLKLSEENKGFVFPVVGVHPTRVQGEKWQDRKALESLTEKKSVVAVGETGLDFHHPRKQQQRLKQYAWFFYQLKLAEKKKLPVVLHIRNADKEAVRVLRLFRGRICGGVVHCFAGGKNVAEKFVELGYHLGIGGTLLQSGERAEKLCEAVKAMPIERILIETDSPYVLPQKAKKNVRNTSLILPKVIEKIAEIKGMEYSEVERIVFENTIRVFGLKLE